jgi:hypothetical protein
MPAGYSKRPLLEKLGIKAGFRMIILNPPSNYDSTLGELPPDTKRAKTLRGPLDFIHFFTRQRDELERQFPKLKRELAENGMLWISWPKGSSKVETNLNEGVVCEIGLRHQLVDIKVCAIDEIWSGLKFVYRLSDRARLGRNQRLSR